MAGIESEKREQTADKIDHAESRADFKWREKAWHQESDDSDGGQEKAEKSGQRLDEKVHGYQGKR